MKSLASTLPPASAAALAVALLAAPGTLLAQGTPQGPEVRVNTYTTSNQVGPWVASDGAGNFVVVWASLYQDGSELGIFAQRYASTGTPLGGEFRVNTYTTNMQRHPSVARDSAGNFVVAWASYAQDGSSYGVFAQRFTITGTPLGGEFRVNTYTTNRQQLPSVASDSTGNFVIAWESVQDGGGYGVFAQLFSSTGAPLGGEFRVNTYTTTNQGGPSVAANSAGNFVVAWNSYTQDGWEWGVFAQRYSSTGFPLGSEFRVNTYTTSYQARPSVAADSSGSFVVAWGSFLQEDGSSNGVFAQRYSSTGVPQGGEFRVNTFTTSYQGGPSVASDSSGNFVVTWFSYTQDGGGFGIFAQRFASTGTPLGGEFRVNSFTSSDQAFQSVASNPAGNFVVTWDSDTQDGSGRGVFAQRYSMIVPVELLDFTVR